MEFYLSQFVIFLLVLVRVLSLFTFSPLFSHASVPNLAKIGLSIFVAYILFLAGEKQFHLVTGALTLGSLLIFVLKEIVTGWILGFSISIVFYAVQFAGHLIGTDMGLTMASIFNPELGENIPVIGQFLYIMAMLIFILLDGHLFLIEALRTSFDIVPLATFDPFINGAFTEHIVRLTGGVIIIAVKIAAPVTAAIFLTTVGLGILSRVVPQMQIFVISMGLNIGIGLFVFAACVPMFIFMLKKLLGQFESETFTLLQMIRP